jgi:outer membrane protein OmpA-like peptidoglycan-associated protein
LLPPGAAAAHSFATGEPCVRHVLRCCLTAAALLVPIRARAQWQGHIDLAPTLPVGGWQPRVFGPGVTGAVSITGQVGAHVDLALSLAGATLTARGPEGRPQGVPEVGPGGFGWFGAGLRLRPYDRGPDGGSRLWIQLAAGVAVTGTAALPGTSLSAGWSFAVGGAELGPFAGWWWLPQTDAEAFPGDAHLLSVGVRLSFPRVVAPVRPPPPPPVVAPPAPAPPRCPDTPSPSVPDVTGDGCPDLDTDGDGLADARDRCPREAEDRDGFEDDDGCPDPDNDRDSIPDTADRCPNEPEVINAVDDEDGCPDQGLVQVIEGRIVLEERVFFDTNSYRIRARSAPLLDAVATLLRRLPPRQPVVLEGHADERGDDRYNHMLSMLRALAVRREMVTRGLAEARFRVLGFGRTVPLRTGRTPEDLATNRRVQVILAGVGSVGVAQSPTGWVRVDADGTRHPVREPAR